MDIASSPLQALFLASERRVADSRTVFLFFAFTTMFFIRRMAIFALKDLLHLVPVVLGIYQVQWKGDGK